MLAADRRVASMERATRDRENREGIGPIDPFYDEDDWGEIEWTPPEETETPEPACTNCCLSIWRLYPEDAEDMQHERFGGLCLECRGPAEGEGHFMTRAKIENIESAYNGFPTDVTKIIVAYVGQRTLPKWTLPGTSLTTTHMPDNIHIMNILGVEDNNNMFGDGIVIDIRWFKSPYCTCVKNPCECVCARRQLMNICHVIGLDHTRIHHFTVALEHTRDENNDNEHILAILRENNHDATHRVVYEAEPEVPQTPCGGACMECAVLKGHGSRPRDKEGQGTDDTSNKEQKTN
jgi:hypothetical protein